MVSSSSSYRNTVGNGTMFVGESNSFLELRNLKMGGYSTLVMTDGSLTLNNVIATLSNECMYGML